MVVEFPLQMHATSQLEGRVVKGFSCKIEFQQDGDDVVHEIYLNPGFRPLKVIYVTASNFPCGQQERLQYSP